MIKIQYVQYIMKKALWILYENKFNENFRPQKIISQSIFLGQTRYTMPFLESNWLSLKLGKFGYI